MADSKAAAELIRLLRKKKYQVTVRGSRAYVQTGERRLWIPGPYARTAGCAMGNVRAQLRRAGIDI